MFNGLKTPMKLPNVQVTPKAERRRFSAEYKLRILAESDGCTERGEIGAMLRREGLHGSHLEKWCGRPDWSSGRVYRDDAEPAGGAALGRLLAAPVLNA